MIDASGINIFGCLYLTRHTAPSLPAQLTRCPNVSIMFAPTPEPYLSRSLSQAGILQIPTFDLLCVTFNHSFSRRFSLQLRLTILLPPVFARTCLCSRLTAPWLGRRPLISLVALLHGPRPFRCLHMQEATCTSHARLSLISQTKTCLAFPRGSLASTSCICRPCLSWSLPKSFWYTSGRTVDRSNVAAK